jgi:hypothetical protein
VASPDRAQRIDLALPPLDDDARERAAEHDWEIDLLDPEDPDERSIPIRLAHPDLHEAVDSGVDEGAGLGRAASVESRALRPAAPRG